MTHEQIHENHFRMIHPLKWFQFMVIRSGSPRFLRNRALRFLDSDFDFSQSHLFWSLSENELDWIRVCDHSRSFTISSSSHRNARQRATLWQHAENMRMTSSTACSNNNLKRKALHDLKQTKWRIVLFLCNGTMQCWCLIGASVRLCERQSVR